MRLVLRESNLILISDEDDKYDFVILAASGKISFDEKRAWISLRLQ